MSLWDKLFGNKEEPPIGYNDTTKISKSLDQNLEAIKADLTDCDDIIYREAYVGKKGDYKIALAYIDGMADRDLLNRDVLSNLMVRVRMADPEPKAIKSKIQDFILDNSLAITDMSEVETHEEAMNFLLSGETVLLLEEYDKAIIIATRAWEARGISEPVTEAVIRGPRDGFVETFRFNTVLIRRRIRDPKLKLKIKQVGRRSKTDIAVMYIEDLVNRRALEKIEERLNAVDIDAVLDSGYIEQLTEDNWLSPFPQIQNTERPDTASAALYDGRIVLVVDNTPFVLILPTTFNALLQSAEDYYERWSIATAVRLLRYLAVFICLLAPSLYVAITSFHPHMIPTELALFIAASRQGIPFPAIVEALIMEATIEILREAGVRLPGPIGATIGIVGGLVIGQAAVEAGIVSPLMVITVAITAISSFAIPNYNLAIGFRLLRFGFIFMAAFLGLYGVALLMLLVMVHLCSLKSFGIPYMSPYTNYIDNPNDLKDTFVLFPLPGLRRRSLISFRKNKVRQKDLRPEDFNKEDQS
ncbi:spore germination protein [Serpentinicella sp. ANB-PHB4]|uniref:spore germination protein n=1 Tax=Serpentinicella sp. ANB-PHB4 TaxID=3074076 RepID=UPI002865428C|nr:spore germination protein [Serpentinicella sp. ANB-PHB4]MDR5659133.1 spore germination protein [Serpentinicella sp. ANB-PHB4]